MLRVSSKILAQALKNGKISPLSGGGYFLPGYEVIPEELLENARILKDSNTTTCAVRNGFFIKRYNRKKFWKRLKRFFGYPRSWGCLAASLLLEEMPLLTPKVFHASRYYLVTEALKEENTLFLSKAPELVRGFLLPLAHLHNNGIFHGDLSLRNIYFDKEKEQYGLIDFDGVALSGSPLTARERELELARIFSSCFALFQEIGKEAALEQILEEYLPLYEKEASMELSREFILKRARHLLKH